ncbi:hypothetical protein IV203_007821 [Nitzschia inconspicua]|uniref:Uncharacterized protein n=1 Tax=Nitzschia inconspicua TaxID=303405 RepID=A0A9K3KXR8_9STRA|nr:hypothetical protein IV203_007821 [Nitzschia inconspicua]
MGCVDNLSCVQLWPEISLGNDDSLTSWPVDVCQWSCPIRYRYRTSSWNKNNNNNNKPVHCLLQQQKQQQQQTSPLPNFFINGTLASNVSWFVAEKAFQIGDTWSVEESYPFIDQIEYRIFVMEILGNSSTLTDLSPFLPTLESLLKITVLLEEKK